MHIVRVSDRPSDRTSCPPVLTMGEHLPLAQVILNVQCVLYSVHTIQNKKMKCTESTTCPVLQSSQWMSTYPQQCIGQGICSIYVMHVTIMHITCSETRSKHSPYNAMGEQLSTYPQQWSKDVRVIVRCWGNSSILCQQNSDALQDALKCFPDSPNYS